MQQKERSWFSKQRKSWEEEEASYLAYSGTDHHFVTLYQEHDDYEWCFNLFFFIKTATDTSSVAVQK